MEVLALLALLITSILCVSSSPLTVDSASPWIAECHTQDSTCTGYNGSLYGDNDPLTSFQIVDPKDGDVNVLPIEIRLHINARSKEEYEAYYGDAYFCVELNGLWKKCKAPGGPPIVFTLLPEGNYTATAYITDKIAQGRCHTTENITFTVLNLSEYDLRNGEMAERSRTEQQFPKVIGLLQWAEQAEIKDKGEDNVVLPRMDVLHTSSPLLVIGVKTAVVTSFPRRQAIRDTWANPVTLPHDVKVLFLGCEPNMTVFENEHDRRRVLQAISKERAVYQDLLTVELGCTDSYRGLSDKVKSFMHLTAAEFPDTKFVMLADDDIYLKIDQLVLNLRQITRPRLYFGEVWAVKFANRQEPIRNPDSPYYLPKTQYPMRNLLPYASGPHYVVSMDSVRFIAKNYWHLKSMNGLEDVSSGFWLRTMQVKAQHTSHFSSVRASMKCEDTLVSFADLSPLGIRSIHANLVNNRSFCHNFHSVTWHRHLSTIPSLDKMLQRPTQEEDQPTRLQLETFINDSDPDQVTVIISTPSNAGIKLQYLSSVDSLDEFTQKLCIEVHHHFPASRTSCQALTTTFHHQLQHLATSAKRQLLVITISSYP